MTKTGPIEIASVSVENLVPSLNAVRGCWKATTMLWMHVMGLPVLSGVIVPDWSEHAATSIRRFCRQNGLSKLLLRIDKPGQRWTNRRGGYLVRTRNAAEVVGQLSKEGMVAILLDPASPYEDRYSLGALALPDEGKIAIEVVGPGFDASDILRSDVEPHERFEAALLLSGRGPSPRGRFQCKRTFLIDPRGYEKTVEQRLVKIGARLEDPAFPNAWLESPPADRKRLIKNAERFLGRSGQDLLLKHRNAYNPIPNSHLGSFLRGVADLLSGLEAYGIHLGTTSISASFIARRRLVFWDFFPARMRDTTGFTPREACRQARSA